MPIDKVTRYCRMDVTLNGEPMERRDFLAGALHIHEWHGVRIGVYDPSTRCLRDRETANFHGVTLYVPLPVLQQEFHRGFCVKIDVIHCADLKLVLPARKEVVQDAFYDQLKLRVERLYFELLQDQGHHSLSYAAYTRALELGMDLPEALMMLRPFVADKADSNENYPAQPVSVPHGASLYIDSEGPIEEQNMARALSRSAEFETIYEPNSAFVGYKWYDDLNRIRVTGYGAVLNGKWKEVSPEEYLGSTDRPDQLSVLIEQTGHHKEICLETDALIIAGEDDTTLDEVEVHVAAGATLTPANLVEFLQAALFAPSDDSEAGSYDQQNDWFTDEAEHLAIHLLVTEAAADENLIRRTIRRELLWRFPKDCNISIAISGGSIDVTCVTTEAGSPQS